jgi:mRNA interferase RelE/StbE
MSKTTYKLVIYQAAIAEIQALTAKIKGSLKVIIHGLAKNPFPVGSTKLKLRGNVYRIRISKYRLIYEVHATEHVVYLVGISHRQEMYPKLLRKR